MKRTQLKRPRRTPLLRRCKEPGKYVRNFLRGLECVGSFTVAPGRFVELYSIPHCRDYGALYSDGCVQIHPGAWHEGRKLDPPPAQPLNTRIRLKQVNGRRKIHFITPRVSLRKRKSSRTKLRGKL